MKELKVHNQHVMKEMKNKKSTEIAEKVSSVYGQKIITDYQVRNWFSRFLSGDTSL